VASVTGRIPASRIRARFHDAAPPEKEFDWSEDGIEGSYRFISRVWQTCEENLDVFADGTAGESAAEADPESYVRLQKKMHQTIKKVGEDIGTRFHLNTAISAIMELTNVVRKERETLNRSAAGRALLGQATERLVLLLAPFTPHLCEELWERMGRTGLVFHASWPTFDPGLARDETVTIAVEVNGKIRDRFEADAGISEAEMRTTALDLPRIRAIIGDQTLRKVVCIKGKIVNIVL
jgi:leucyl-tRNA synthetase